MKPRVQIPIAILAFTVIFVIPSVASASPELTFPTGNKAIGDHESAGKGLLIEATNVAHNSTAKNAVLTTPLGNVECAKVTLTGTLISNSGTQIQGEINTANFSGTPANSASTHCSGPGGLGTITVTPSHTNSGPEHEYEGGKKSKSLPWCIKVEGANDEFSVRGGSCTDATRPLLFTLDSSILGSCTYRKASLVGTYTTHPVDAVMTISNQEFTRVTGSSFCPSSGDLDMSFTLTKDGTNEAVYIK